MRTSTVLIAMGAVLALPLIASCSGSTSGGEATSSSAAIPSMATAPAAPTPALPACDDAGLTPAVVTAIGPDQALRQISGLQCDGEWAVVFPTIGPPDGSTDGEIDITLVFRAQGGAWLEQDRTAVCGTLPTGNGSPAYPGDAQVPESLWQGACQTN